MSTNRTLKEKKPIERKLPLSEFTIETLHVIDTANIILEEKFRGNTEKWLEAIFQSLQISNTSYLREETASAPEKDIFDELNAEIEKTFNADAADENLLQLGTNLIYNFNKFITQLQLRLCEHVPNELVAALQRVNGDIRLYLKTSQAASNSDGGIATKSPAPSYKHFIRASLNGSIKQHSIYIDITSSTTLYCTLCECSLTVQNIQSHVSGKIHLKKYRNLNADDAGSGSPGKLEFANEEQKKCIRHAVCDLCSCAVSVANVPSHVAGKAHKRRYEEKQNL